MSPESHLPHTNEATMSAQSARNDTVKRRTAAGTGMQRAGQDRWTDGEPTHPNVESEPLPQEIDYLGSWQSSIFLWQSLRQELGTQREDYRQSFAGSSTNAIPRPALVKPLFARAFQDGMLAAFDDADLVAPIAIFVKAATTSSAKMVSTAELRTARQKLESLEVGKTESATTNASFSPKVYAEAAWHCLVETDDAPSEQ